MSLTVGKALALLRLIAQAENPLGLMQIAERGGLDKSTAARLLAPLAKDGLISRSSNKRYALGAGVFALATSYIGRNDVRRLAQPSLRRIRDAIRETVTLHLLMGEMRVCLDGVESPEEVRRAVPLGEIQKLHEGPTGKVILASLPPARRAAILAGQALSPAELAELRSQFDRIARDGFMAAADDRVLGISGLSAPIFNSLGVCGSITVAGPKERLTRSRMEAAAPLLLSEVAQLSAALGGGASVPPARDRSAHRKPDRKTQRA
jgi:IclR family transcriptional regulator, acetate operon repressor